jgi:hypothetical protein
MGFAYGLLSCEGGYQRFEGTYRLHIQSRN